jgi:hypothetical protein
MRAGQTNEDRPGFPTPDEPLPAPENDARNRSRSRMAPGPIPNLHNGGKKVKTRNVWKQVLVGVTTGLLAAALLASPAGAKGMERASPQSTGAVSPPINVNVYAPVLVNTVVVVSVNSAGPLIVNNISQIQFAPRGSNSSKGCQQAAVSCN